jgi:hypothetical protein
MIPLIGDHHKITALVTQVSVIPFPKLAFTFKVSVSKLDNRSIQVTDGSRKTNAPYGRKFMMTGSDICSQNADLA